MWSCLEKGGVTCFLCVKVLLPQVINSDWDGHRLSYDLAVLFTGKMDFKDGDGYAYIGGICQQ